MMQPGNSKKKYGYNITQITWLTDRDTSIIPILKLITILLIDVFPTDYGVGRDFVGSLVLESPPCNIVQSRFSYLDL